jgi:hypothetical protein
MKGKVIKLLIVVAFLMPLSAPSHAGENYGTRDNFDRGWQSDENSDRRDIEDSFGRAYQPSGNEGRRGTRDNFDRGWQSDENSDRRDTEDSFGRGYQNN